MVTRCNVRVWGRIRGNGQGGQRKHHIISRLHEFMQNIHDSIWRKQSHFLIDTFINRLHGLTTRSIGDASITQRYVHLYMLSITHKNENLLCIPLCLLLDGRAGRVRERFMMLIVTKNNWSPFGGNCIFLFLLTSVICIIFLYLFTLLVCVICLHLLTLVICIIFLNILPCPLLFSFD